MNSWLREAGKKLFAFLAVLTLTVQSVLPVCADTVDAGQDAAASGDTVSEDDEVYALDYFDFDLEKAKQRILALNPKAIFFPISAKTGEGIGAVCEWILQELDAVRDARA